MASKRQKEQGAGGVRCLNTRWQLTPPLPQRQYRKTFGRIPAARPLSLEGDRVAEAIKRTHNTAPSDANHRPISSMAWEIGGSRTKIQRPEQHPAG